MNNLDKQYFELVTEILEDGNKKSDRTGTGTYSLFGRSIRHNMDDGFPILTSKFMHFKSVAEELLWFLSGNTSIVPLLEKGVTIWLGDSYKSYLKSIDVLSEDIPLSKEDFAKKLVEDEEFAMIYGDLGPVYGKQWRNWEGFKAGMSLYHDLEWETKDHYDKEHIDQIKIAIDLIKNNPDSRRILVNAWNPEAISDSVLPPCHYSFQFYVRHKADKKYLSLLFNMRSADLGLGVPFNLASYGLLLEIISKMTNCIPDELIANFGDVHIYQDHIEGLNKQLKNDIHPLPSLQISDRSVKDPMNYKFEDFKLINYVHSGKINLPLSN